MEKMRKLNARVVKNVSTVIKNSCNGFCVGDLVNNKHFGVSPGTAISYVKWLKKNKSIKFFKMSGKKKLYKVIAPLNFNRFSKSVIPLKDLVDSCLTKMHEKHFTFIDLFSELPFEHRKSTKSESFRTTFYKYVNSGEVTRLDKNLYTVTKKPITKKVKSKKPVVKSPDHNQQNEVNSKKVTAIEAGKNIFLYIQNLQQTNIKLHQELKDSKEINNGLLKESLKEYEQKYQESNIRIRELQIQVKNLKDCPKNFIAKGAHNNIVKNLNKTITKLTNQLNEEIIFTSMAELKTLSKRK